MGIFMDHKISHQPSKFQSSRMLESNFTDGGGVENTLPSALSGLRSPVILGLTR